MKNLIRTYFFILIPIFNSVVAMNGIPEYFECIEFGFLAARTHILCEFIYFSLDQKKSFIYMQAVNYARCKDFNLLFRADRERGRDKVREKSLLCSRRKHI